MVTEFSAQGKLKETPLRLMELLLCTVASCYLSRHIQAAASAAL
jgi:hypothetical protein